MGTFTSPLVTMQDGAVLPLLEGVPSATGSIFPGAGATP